jgi:PAS domain S-box-containing protein
MIETLDAGATCEGECGRAERAAWFQAMFHEAPIATIITSATGRIRQVNAAFTRLLGYAPEHVRDHPVEDITHPDDRAMTSDNIRHSAERGRQQYEKRYLHRDGSTVPVFLTVSVSEVDGTRYLIGQVLDLTALRQSQHRFEEIAGTISEVFWISDPTTEAMLYISPAYERLWGRSGRSLLAEPRSFLEAVHADDRKRVVAAVATKKCGENYECEYRIVRPDGSVRDVWDRGYPARDDAGRLTHYIGVAVDVTERKRAERECRENAARMQALARRVVESRETEQRRLSAELHDRIGQSLTALGLNLDIAGQALPGACRKVAQRLRDSRVLVQETMAAVRDLITGLRPVALDHDGLLSGLRWHCAQVARRTGLAIEITGDEPSPRLEAGVESALFRIAQEALNNTVKHAAARCVDIALERGPQGCTLVIADDGKGFAPVAPGPADDRSHWGLDVMRERAEAVGARFRARSERGQGTRIEVEVPRAA